MKKKDILTCNEVIANNYNNNLLTVTKSTTVQPVALMRLGVFVPKPKRKKTDVLRSIDVSEIFSNLELSRAEGYNDIKLVGPRLDMEVDFKIWIGIIHAFSKYGNNGNEIKLKYTEFAKYCGFNPSRLGKKLKNDIKESLLRISSKRIMFSKKNCDNRNYITGLLQSADINIDTNIITLRADEKLWELYKFDNTVLIQLDTIKRLQRKESAQALYTFIEALPEHPAPLSFNRLKDRLLLTSLQKEQNRLIRTAIINLIEIGYLEIEGVLKLKNNDGSYTYDYADCFRKDTKGDIYIHIIKRNRFKLLKGSSFL